MPVTEHAVERFQRRVARVGEAEARKVLEEIVYGHKPVARPLKVYRRYCGKRYVAIVQKSVVITVLEYQKPSRKRWKWWE